jgi:hypothetical protein
VSEETMPDKDINLTLSLSKEQEKFINQMAEARGETVSELVCSIVLGEIETLAELPKSIGDQLIEISKAMKLPVSTLLVHFLARKFAFHEAYFKVFKDTGQPFKEFFWADNEDGTRRLVTGQELYDTLTDDYERLFREFQGVIREMVQARQAAGLESQEDMDRRYAEFVLGL